LEANSFDEKEYSTRVQRIKLDGRDIAFLFIG
jgi:hypothetical protein